MGLLTRKSKAATEPAAASPAGRPSQPEKQDTPAETPPPPVFMGQKSNPAPVYEEKEQPESKPAEESKSQPPPETPAENQEDRAKRAEAMMKSAGARGSGYGMYVAQKQSHDDLQHKTFLRWWNAELPKAGPNKTQMLEELPQGLADGVAPIRLIENLGGGKLKGTNMAPKNPMQKLENHNIFLKKVSDMGIVLTGIGPEVSADTKVCLLNLLGSMSPYEPQV